MRREPLLAMGRAMVALPPGVFLQATAAGEETLAAKVCAHLAEARHIADLFSGVGTFALRMAEFASVDAFDLDEAALKALAKAARVEGLRPVNVKTRDLFRRPLEPADLAQFDAVAVRSSPRGGRTASPWTERIPGAASRRRILQCSNLCARRRDPLRGGL